MKNLFKINRFCVLAVALAIATSAQAGSFSSSLPEFNGAGTNTTADWGTMTFSIPLGEVTTYAFLSGQFGNSVTGSTSVHDVYADGILVASCPDQGSFCWTTGPESWSYTFTGSELSIFNDGMVVMTTNQTDCCTVREGELSLRGLTAPIPEPEAYAMLLAGLGLLGGIARRRKQKLSA